LFSKFQLEPVVILWIVPKVGKLVPRWEDSWFCGRGRGGLFGPVFDCIVWVPAMGYVICKGSEGYVIVGCRVWA
jgi:hypothetical protein